MVGAIFLVVAFLAIGANSQWSHQQHAAHMQQQYQQQMYQQQLAQQMAQQQMMAHHQQNPMGMPQMHHQAQPVIKKAHKPGMSKVTSKVSKLVM